MPHERNLTITCCNERLHGFPQAVFAETFRAEIATLTPPGGGVAQMLQEADEGSIAQITTEKTGNNHHALLALGRGQLAQQRGRDIQDSHICQRPRSVTERQQQMWCFIFMRRFFVWSALAFSSCSVWFSI